MASPPRGSSRCTANAWSGGTFDPGFRISLHQKDLNLALAGARELNLNLPNTANAQQVFSTCAAIGGSNWDHSALIKGLEHMANFSIRDE